MNRFKMDESIPSRSFISLSNSDSGLTLLKADSLVRKVAEQEEELKRKDERINDLEEQVIDLQDIIEKCMYESDCSIRIKDITFVILLPFLLSYSAYLNIQSLSFADWGIRSFINLQLMLLIAGHRSKIIKCLQSSISVIQNLGIFTSIHTPQML